jgi:hypothetical protein
MTLFKKLRVPHTLVLLYGMIVLAYLLTMVLPAGQFETEMNAHGHEVVVPGTYAVIADTDPLPFWSLFTVIPRGLESAQGIIFFVFIIGGALAVLRATGALDAALARVLRRFGGQPALLILMGMLAFAVGSSTIGMAEEYIPLVAMYANGYRGSGRHHGGGLWNRLRHGGNESIHSPGGPGGCRADPGVRYRFPSGHIPAVFYPGLHPCASIRAQSPFRSDRFPGG